MEGYEAGVFKEIAHEPESYIIFARAASIIWLELNHTRW